MSPWFRRKSPSRMEQFKRGHAAKISTLGKQQKELEALSKRIAEISREHSSLVTELHTEKDSAARLRIEESIRDKLDHLKFLKEQSAKARGENNL